MGSELEILRDWADANPLGFKSVVSLAQYSMDKPEWPDFKIIVMMYYAGKDYISGLTMDQVFDWYELMISYRIDSSPEERLKAALLRYTWSAAKLTPETVLPYTRWLETRGNTITLVSALDSILQKVGLGIGPRLDRED